MVKTYNRTPQQVNVPSGSSQSYLIQADWKGIIESKNYLTVDQNSFEETKNVYIGEDGLLQSRPSLVTIDNLHRSEPGDNIYVFDDILVQVYNTNIVKISKGSEQLAYFSLQSALVNIVKENAKIYFFCVNNISYYDTINNVFILDGTSDIYVPETIISVDGSEIEEPKNLLTNGRKQVSILTQGDIVPPDCIGKNVTVRTDTDTVVTNKLLENSKFFGKYNSKVTRQTVIRNNRLVYKNNDDIVYVVYDTITNTETSTIIRLPNDVNRFTLSNDGKILLVWNDTDVYKLDLTIGSSLTDFVKVNFDLKAIIPRDYQVLAVTADDNDLIVILVKIGTTDENGTGFKIGFLYGSDVNNLTYVKLSDNVCRYYLYSTRNNYNIKLKRGENLSTFVVETDGIDPGYPHAHIMIRTNAVVRFVNSAIPILDFTPSSNDDIWYFLMYDTSYTVYEYTIDQKSNLKGTISNEPLTYAYSKFVGDYSPDVIINTNIYSYKDTGFKLNGNAIVSNENVQLLTAQDGVITYLSESTVENYYNLYSSIRWSTVELSYVDGTGYMNPFSTKSKFAQLNSWYVNKDNFVYISKPKYDSNGQFKWYFPETSFNKFNSNITNLHPLSKTEMGIFLENELWYATYDVEGDFNHFVKSKIQGGCKDGADVITTFDGKYIIFATERGLAYLTYQDFVATTEQSLTFLSDTISKSFVDFAKYPVKLYQYKYWIYCYNTVEKQGYLFDLRNQSWWKFEIPIAVKNIVTYVPPILLSDTYYTIRNDLTQDYLLNETLVVDWKVVSQKLHFDAINNYKHITDIVLNFVSDERERNTIKIMFKSYDKLVTDTSNVTLEYDVDMIRSFVKKLNLYKVNALQYILQSDEGNKYSGKLALSDIAIKYGIKGQVR